MRMRLAIRKSATHCGLRNWFRLAALSLTLWLAGAAAPAAAGADKPKPLYPVRIDHAFPDAKAAFEETMRLILENYYTDEIDEKTLYWGAIRGMLAQISPAENRELAAIWPPEDFDRVEANLRGSQESVGIRSSFNPADGSLTVTEVYPGGPAENLLQPHDRIVRIDGKPLKGLAVRDLEKLLKGEAGTSVGLKIVRDAAVLDLQVTRGQVRTPNLETAALAKGVGYLRLALFADGVSAEMAAALEKLQKDGAMARGLIVDLRGNGGGMFNEALKCAELFIAKPKAMLRLAEKGGTIKSYVSENQRPLALPLIVLLDKGSASGSEVFAAALRDAAGARLVGSETFGKATMERIFTLGNQYRVKFTSAALYSPRGISWQRRGVLPDFPVDQDAGLLEKTRRLSPELRLLNDPQLMVAHRLLAEP